MSISREDVLHVARLAHLELSEAEIEAMIHDLGEILDYADRLQKLDLDDEAVEREDESVPLRPDAVEPWLEPGRATESAPGASESFFVVPPVIEGR